MILQELIPDRYYKTPQLARLFSACDTTLEQAQADIEDFLRQTDVETATWGLAYYERDYGITAQANAALEERRAQVKARMRGIGVCTVKMLESLAAAYVEGQTTVEDLQELFLITFHFPDHFGRPEFLEQLHGDVLRVRPAHMLIEYIFRCLKVHEVDGMTVDELSGCVLWNFAQ